MEGKGNKEESKGHVNFRVEKKTEIFFQVEYMKPIAPSKCNISHRKNPNHPKWLHNIQLPIVYIYVH